MSAGGTGGREARARRGDVPAPDEELFMGEVAAFYTWCVASPPRIVLAKEIIIPLRKGLP